MIYFKTFKPQRSQRKYYKRKPGVLRFPGGEKSNDWPTNRLGHKE